MVRVCFVIGCMFCNWGYVSKEGVCLVMFHNRGYVSK